MPIDKRIETGVGIIIMAIRINFAAFIFYTP